MKTEDGFLYKDLTYKIIGAAMEVHRVLGFGFLESVYEDALCYELKSKGIGFERQVEIVIQYKDIILPKTFRADLVVGGKVLIENKSTTGLTSTDEAQMLNCLKATKLRIGLLFNFGKTSLEYERRVY